MVRAQEPSPGLLLGGRYRLTAKLGRGGMGEVWVARDETIRIDVAVKLLGETGTPAFLQEARARFDAEQRALAQLRSPYVVQIRDRGATDYGQPWFVMDLLDGKSLQEHLDIRGRLTVRETLELLEDLGRAIQEPHAKGLVHRDLKPGNIFLLEYTGQRRLDVRLLDFGIAKSMTDADPEMAKTQPGMMVGTPLYVAPEQIQGKPQEASDVYAIGVVAYRCLAGRTPFTGDQVAVLSQHLAAPVPRFDVNLNIPSMVEDLVRSLLEKAPDRRPSANELVASVEDILLSLSEPSFPLDTPTRGLISRSASRPATNGSRPRPISGSYPRTPSSLVSGPRSAPGVDGSQGGHVAPFSDAAAEASPRPIGFETPIDSSSGARVGGTPDTLGGTPDEVIAPRRWGPAVIGLLLVLTVAMLGWYLLTRDRLPVRAPTTAVALRIDSTPPGARARLGEIDLGETPVIARVDPASTPRRLVLMLDGHETLRRTVMVDRDMYLDLALVRLPEPKPVEPVSAAAAVEEPKEKTSEPERDRTSANRDSRNRRNRNLRGRRDARRREDSRPKEAVEMPTTPEVVEAGPARVMFIAGPSGNAVKIRIGSKLYPGTPLRIPLQRGQLVEVKHLGADGVWRTTTVRVPNSGNPKVPLN